MALVDYPSSDEDEDENENTSPSVQPPPNLKRKHEEQDVPSDLPPLPTKFHDLYASTSRLSTVDDPSLHGGRKRVKPHVEGSWPTHIYIEWYPSTAESSSLAKVISETKSELASENGDQTHSFLVSDLDAPLPLHISLSRPIGFATAQKDDFGDSLNRAVISSGIRPFDFSFTGLDWVPNFERTRWFLVLRIGKPDTDALNKLLHVTNTIVQEYGQPPLYTEPLETKNKKKTSQKATPTKNTKDRRLQSNQPLWKWSDMSDGSSAFHISIAWTLSAPSKEVLQATKLLMRENSEGIKQIKVTVEDIKSKVGNVVTSIPLRKAVLQGTSLFGI